METLIIEIPDQDQELGAIKQIEWILRAFNQKEQVRMMDFVKSRLGITSEIVVSGQPVELTQWDKDHPNGAMCKSEYCRCKD